MIGGGTALILGSFLPWIKASAPFVGTITKAGTDGGGDGWIVVACGVVAIVLGVNAINGPQWASRAAIVFAVLTAIVVGYEFVQVHDRLDSVRGESLIQADYGVGLFLCAAGAVAVFVGGMLAADRADKLRDDKVLNEEFGENLTAARTSDFS